MNAAPADEIADELEETMKLTCGQGMNMEDALRLATNVQRLILKERAPVTIEQIAAATGEPASIISAQLEAIPLAIEYDEAGDVVGLGLSLNPTAHRFEVNGATFYAWCALDTLTFPRTLGVTAEITSTSPRSGRKIKVKASPEKVLVVEPKTAVVSFVSIDKIDETANLRADFCSFVHYFSDQDDAAGWLADHPNAGLLPVKDAFELGRKMHEAWCG